MMYSNTECICKLIYYDDDVHCVNFDLHFFKFIHKKWRVVIYKTVYWRNTLHYFLFHNSACFHIFTMHSSWYKQEGVVGLLFLLLLTTMCFIENFIQKLYVLAGTWCSLHSTTHNNYIVLYCTWCEEEHKVLFKHHVVHLRYKIRLLSYFVRDVVNGTLLQD